MLSGTVSFNDSKAEWTRPYSVELPPNNRDAILAKRPYRRTRYFGRNELSGLVMGALRLATRPLTSAEIATAVLHAKEMPTGDMAFKEIVLTVLRRDCAWHGAMALGDGHLLASARFEGSGGYWQIVLPHWSYQHCRW